MRRVLLAAIVAALLSAAPAGAWTWPVAGPVLQPFVFDPAHPYAAGQHRGIDVGAQPGDLVAAPASGTIAFAGSVPTSGLTVTITTADGYAVTLTHLGSITAAAGASVAEGDPVALAGSSGVPELPQTSVHLGIRVAAQAQGYVDPLGLLPPLARAPSPPPAAAQPAPAPAAAPSTPAAPVASAASPPRDVEPPAQPSAPAAAAVPDDSDPGGALTVVAARGRHPQAHASAAGRTAQPVPVSPPTTVAATAPAPVERPAATTHVRPAAPVAAPAPRRGPTAAASGQGATVPDRGA